MFDNSDYQRAATRLGVPVSYVKAMAAVESAGETIWLIDGKELPPVRFETHWFGKLTGYRFNDDHPDLSSVSWDPSLAANTRAGAWDQLNRAAALDRNAAYESASWGPFQVMGFHWKRLGYISVEDFANSMLSNGDDGGMDAFVRFIEADPTLHASLRNGDWGDVERRYNGGGYGGAYAVKLRAAVAQYSGDEIGAVPRVLRKGDKGADVAILQAALVIKADGDFGPWTEAAVRLYQADHGLVADGIVGNMTRRELGI